MAALEQAGIAEACFTDHLWDEAAGEANAWYASQGLQRMAAVREALRNLRTKSGLRLHFGCETELKDDGTLGLLPEHAEHFDFILVPHNHLHISGFTRPAELKDSADVRRLLLRHFHICCDTIPFRFAFAHPFTPYGFFERQSEILAGITDREYEECFQAAAARNASIEFNATALLRKSKPPVTGPGQDSTLHREYKRMYQIAVDCGCSFHLGSDAHAPTTINRENYRIIREFAEECGAQLTAPIG